MSVEKNKALLHHYMKAVWDEENPAAVNEFLAPHYKRHRSPTSPPLTRDSQMQLLNGFRAAFPDIQIMVEEIIAEGDMVTFRSTMRGTHQGKFLNIAPTGKVVTVGLIDIIRVENGKFVEQWGGPNLFDLLQQLGAEFSTGI